MKGYNKWSYTPYIPLLHNMGDIYICRVAPDKDFIHLEWLGIEADEYSVYYRKRDNGEFILCGKTASCEFDIKNLDTDTDFEFYIKSGDKKSLVRLARTGEAVGTVINYVHPDDKTYSFSGQYLGSPCIVQHPEGYLLASMDIFAIDHPQNLTFIFRSDDNGKTWHHVSELMPCFWGRMFIHKGEIYMLSVSTEYGDLLIGKSTDGGKTFSAPVSLLRGSNAKNGNNGVHKSPQNIFIHNGRLYNSLEWGTWLNNDYYHAAMVMSCDVDDDLLVPENWSITEPVKYDPNWPGTVDGVALGTMEGTIVLCPDGNLYNVMRYCIKEATPAYGLVLSYKINTEDPDAPLEYSHSIKMPCNNSKFIIKFDPVTKRYYSIVSRIDCEEHAQSRSLLSLMASSDMENWELVCDLIDRRHEGIEKVGFQYVDYEFQGEDIIYICRTAMNDANTYHNSNYITFHRIKNFRNL